jgi:aminoglycoside 3-N-acetyltransferase I
MRTGAIATVRRLGGGEHAAMRALNRMFAEAFEDPESYDRATPTDAYLNRVLARETTFALVAEPWRRQGIATALIDRSAG